MPAATPIGGSLARFRGGPEAARSRFSRDRHASFGSFHQGDNLWLEEQLPALDELDLMLGEQQVDNIHGLGSTSGIVTRRAKTRRGSVKR